MMEYYILKFTSCWLAVGVLKGCVTIVGNGDTEAEAEYDMQQRVANLFLDTKIVYRRLN
jgi:hypothetical protein